MQIIPLPEGTYTVGRDKVFKTFDASIHKLEDRSIGSLLVEVQPFLVITKNDYIILDTGLGYHSEYGNMIIHENLSKHNIHPDQITKVLLSHLHKDHAGGISYINEYNERVLTFPNAHYYVNKNEFEFALHANTNSYLYDDIKILENNANTIFLTEESGNITPEIYYKHSGGHCPHHVVFKIKEDNEIVFFAGDEASQLKQLKIRYIAKYDYDGKLAADLRDKYAKQAKEQNWKIMFYHDVNLPISTL